MKKLFTLLAATLMLSANAETLTVYDGSNWDYYVPINSLWLDEADVRTQVLFPAADLNEMNGKAIKSMTFYTDEYGCYMNGGLLTISLGETNVNELETYIEDLTEVGTLTMTKHTYEVVEIKIDFATPYVYNGGNLVFDAFVTQPGSYGITYFMGVKPNYFNALTYSYGSISQRSFLPKTTFEYENVDTPTPPTPTEETAAPTFNGYTTDGIHAYFVEINPTEPSDIYYRIQFPDGTWTDWALYEEILSFTGNGKYRVEAYAVAPGKLPSTEIAYEFVVSPFTGISEMTADKAVANVRYFNMAGQEMQQANGMTIVVTTYTDGTTSSVKVMK